MREIVTLYEMHKAAAMRSELESMNPSHSKHMRASIIEDANRQHKLAKFWGDCLRARS